MHLADLPPMFQVQVCVGTVQQLQPAFVESGSTLSELPCEAIGPGDLQAQHAHARTSLGSHEVLRQSVHVQGSSFVQGTGCKASLM